MRALPGEIALGELDQREGVPFEFRLENRSREEIVITEVSRPCSCTQLDLPTGSMIGPGDKLRVPGSVDTTSRRGSYETAVAVSYRVKGAAPQHTLAIPIRMSIRPSITASPEVVKVDERAWAAVDLGPGSARSFRILEIEASDPYIRWEPVASRLGEDCSEFRLRLRLDRSQVPDWAAGSHGPHWLLITTSVASEPQFRLPVVVEPSLLRERIAEH